MAFTVYNLFSLVYQSQQRSAEPTYDRILNQILDVHLAPGARLVEAQLAGQLGVSRTPVREALFRLQQEGFVETELRRGFTVRRLTEREAREAYPVVAALESEGLAECSVLVKSDVVRLRKANRALYAARANARAAVKADRAFHLMLVERSANSLLLRTIRTLHRVLTRYELLYMSDASLIMESVEQHESIIVAIADGKIRSACDALRRNYAVGMQAVVNRIRQ